jgi:hypothetical protein
MTAVEVAAATKAPAKGGALIPLELVRGDAPVSCTPEYYLAAKLADVATAKEAAAYWLGRVAGSFQRPTAESGVAPAENMSVTELAATRSTWC